MNPDFRTDGYADFCFDAFNEAHAHPAEFIGGPDRGGNFRVCDRKVTLGQAAILILR